MRPALALLALTALPVAAQEIRPPGQRPDSPGAHALVGGRVVVAPGKVIHPGTVVVRDGLIVGVGEQVEVPADARVWDAKGLTIYAGFIDAYATFEAGGGPAAAPRGEGPRAADTGFVGAPGTQRDPGQPGPGSALAKMTPERRALDGLSPEPKVLDEWRDIGFAAANVVPGKGVLRGTSALISLGDGDPSRLVIRADTCLVASLESGIQEETETFPSSMMAGIAAIRQALLDAEWRAADLAHYERHANERRRPAADPSLDALLPVIQGERPVVFDCSGALVVDFAARLAKERGVKFLIRASGQEWRRPDLAGAAGAPMIVPLDFPEAPKLPDESDWSQVSLDQLRVWDWAPENAALLVSKGVEIALTSHGLQDKDAFRRNLRKAVDRGLSEDAALAALTTAPAKILGVGERLGTVEKGRIANLTVVKGSYFDPEAKVVEVWADGRRYAVKAGERVTPGAKDEDPKKKEEAEKKKKERRELESKRVARAPLDERGPDAAPEAVLVKGATVWTCGPAGRLEKADLLCAGGKIAKVGNGIEAPAGATVIDGAGLHVTPGLLDCHSHAAIVGDVNEGTLPSSAMVRIQDVVNSETDHIAQELAGGLTVANLLHGSANPIGGQNCVIKLREGASPDGMVFKEAIAGIKFALGENVKQSNWGEKFVTRFPQTRMGVKTFFVNRFTAARQYLEARERRASDAAPLRRDLELEALGEILKGTRLIHCHSYRADEILMLIRVMEDFGVRIGTFQHVLEGYKVADEIARHGAGGSCFTDWWAYKFEVYDAIPYAGALMASRGVVSSFNSDSAELARRMNLEAAKAVKYGGVKEEEALKFVTLNPAIQLRVDRWVGSLEPGKDADFAIWTHSPLDTRTVCVQTWIEGKRYYERGRAAERAEARRKEWGALKEKASKVAEGGDGRGGGAKDGGKFWETAIEKRWDYGWEVDCMGAHEIGDERR